VYPNSSNNSPSKCPLGLRWGLAVLRVLQSGCEDRCRSLRSSRSPLRVETLKSYHNKTRVGEIGSFRRPIGLRYKNLSPALWLKSLRGLLPLLKGGRRETDKNLFISYLRYLYRVLLEALRIKTTGSIK